MSVRHVCEEKVTKFVPLPSPSNPSHFQFHFFGSLVPRTLIRNTSPLQIGAFESREYLRKLCVGKVIQFRTLYQVAPRDYGTVTLQGGQDLLELVVENGWVKLRDDAEKKDESVATLESGGLLVPKFRELEMVAKSENRGVWSGSLQRIENVYEFASLAGFLDTWKGRSIEGESMGWSLCLGLRC